MLVACHIAMVGHREQLPRLTRLCKDLANGTDVMNGADAEPTVLTHSPCLSVHERGLTAPTHTSHWGADASQF